MLVSARQQSLARFWAKFKSNPHLSISSFIGSARETENDVRQALQSELNLGSVKYNWRIDRERGKISPNAFDMARRLADVPKISMSSCNVLSCLSKFPTREITLRRFCPSA
jgi:hypothetical protein